MNEDAEIARLPRSSSRAPAARHARLTKQAVFENTLALSRKPIVVVVDTLAAVCLEVIEEVASVRYFPTADYDSIRPHLLDADAIVVRSSRIITGEWLDDAPALRLILRAGAGTDNLPHERAAARGIEMVSFGTHNAQSVAEYAVGGMLALLRHLVPAATSLATGAWEKETFLGSELTGRIVGLVGLGNIGSAIASMLAGFDVELLGTRCSALPAPPGVRLVSLSELCRRASVISVQVPLRRDTNQLLGDAEISLMRDAYLVNVARWDIIDSDALRRGLDRGNLRAALIDPTNPELAAACSNWPNPPVLLPHLGGSTVEAQSRLGRAIAATLADRFHNDHLSHEAAR